MGPSPVSAVAQRVSLKRVTVYALLDALIARGLVTTVDTDSGRRYFPQDPSCLFERLEDEKLKLQEKWTLTEQCVKELEAPFFASVTELRRVRFHEGFLSVERALQEYFLNSAPLNGLIALTEDVEAKRVVEGLRAEREALGQLTVLEHVDAALFSGGSLLVQNDTVGFLGTRASLELMVIRDPFYAQYVKQVLFSPYFSKESSPGKKSVGATISRRSPVKG